MTSQDPRSRSHTRQSMGDLGLVATLARAWEIEDGLVATLARAWEIEDQSPNLSFAFLVAGRLPVGARYVPQRASSV
jgi:hypothetical protein